MWWLYKARTGLFFYFGTSLSSSRIISIKDETDEISITLRVILTLKNFA